MIPAGPFHSPGFHLWHAAMSWRSGVTEALGGKLTATQFFVLGAINWLQKTRGAPTQAEVSSFCGVDAMTVSQVVRTLAKAKLLLRKDDPNDTRSWRLETTEAGAALVMQSAARVRELDRRFFAGVSEHTLNEIERLNPDRKESR